MSPVIRFALLLLSVAFTTKVIAQDEHKLFWHKDSLLKWSDFKGPTDASSKFHASTFCEIFSKYNWTVKNNKYIFIFTTGSYLNTSRSWSVKEKQTPELLRHEQLHFNIAELFARRYLQLLNKAVYTSTFKTTIDRINQDNLHTLKVMQDLYDEQTYHSEDKYMQAKWEAYIAKLLNSKGLIDAAMLRGPKK
ncbi:hypothetical protein ACFQZS_10255 [Mucilaginibacter calamicampi]|uniref:DUF922 domain-containing protein n=1 Tax=Mucilaginibacter calamicampi TaxID=1302352 RepID=A0ABW2Z198_9SPHI